MDNEIDMVDDGNGTFSMFQPPSEIEESVLDYKHEFGEDADFLLGKKKRISHRHRNTWYEDAQDIKEAHDRLATHGRESKFSTWLADLEEPISIRTANRYIWRVKFIWTSGPDKKEYLLTLPVRVLDEAAAPSAPQALIDGVLNGTVKTLAKVNEIKYGAKSSTKEKDLQKKLDEANARAERAERERDEAKEEAKREKRDRLNARYDTVPQAKELLDTNAYLEEQYSREKGRNEELRSRAVMAERQLKEATARAKKAESERDAAKNVLDVTNRILKNKESESDDVKAQAERERDAAKAEAASLREQMDSIIAERDSFRETIRKKDEELLNRPQVETVVTKEVVPDDYEALKDGNKSLRRQLAELRAHAQGMSLQEYSQKDERHKEFVKTIDEEYAASKKVRNILSTLVELYEHEAEIREDVRCYLKVASDREETLADAQDTIRRADAGLEVMKDAFFMASPLKVVK